MSTFLTLDQIAADITYGNDNVECIAFWDTVQYSSVF